MADIDESIFQGLVQPLVDGETGIVFLLCGFARRHFLDHRDGRFACLFDILKFAVSDSRKQCNTECGTLFGIDGADLLPKGVGEDLLP